MTPHASYKDEGHIPPDFDLSQIFIGREQQMDFFDLYLSRWQKLMAATPPVPDDLVVIAPNPNNKIQGLVVLLYGRGGFGKSILLKHYRNMAVRDSQKLVVSNIVDWEFAIEGKRGLFNPAPGQEINALEYFSFLRNQLAGALKRHSEDFNEYQAAVTKVDEARRQASKVLSSLQKDDGYTSLRLLAGPGAMALLRWIEPHVGQALDSIQATKKIEEVMGQGVQIGAEQLVHAYSKLRDMLGRKIDDYLTPELRLGLALGRDLSRLAKNFPLLIFFDTYEEVDEADHLLRIVMGAASKRVGWVIAGRDNLWRSRAMEYGYKDLVHLDRGLSINFNADDIGAFTISDIQQYFDLLCKMGSNERSLPRVAQEEASRIQKVTLGVPLAIKIAAGLYLETENLELVTEKTESKRSIVDQMVRRYLLHTRANQHERAKLYGLALLRRADQPPAIAAALGLSSEQARASYETELSRLQRRYSFVFTEKVQPALHQEVRYFLRLWLLEHHKEPEIVVVNEQLKQAHETTLKDLEDRRQYRSLRERLEDEEWIGIYLDLVEQQFWLDSATGVRDCLPFLLAAAIYQRDVNQDAIKVGEFFEASMRQPYLRQWEWAAASLVYTDSHYPSRGALTGLAQLEKLAHQHSPAFPLPLPAYQAELMAAIYWRLGEAHQGSDNNKALEWYEKALNVLDQQTELRDIAAQTAWAQAHKLYLEKRHAERIPYALS